MNICKMSCFGKNSKKTISDRVAFRMVYFPGYKGPPIKSILYCYVFFSIMCLSGCSGPLYYKDSIHEIEYLCYNVEPRADDERTTVLRKIPNPEKLELSLRGDLGSMAVSPDGQDIALYINRGSKGDVIYFIDALSFQIKHSFKVLPPGCDGAWSVRLNPKDLAFNSDASIIATYYRLNKDCFTGPERKTLSGVPVITIWDIATGNSLLQIEVPLSDPIYPEDTYAITQFGLMFSPNDKYIAVYLSYTPGPKYFCYSMKKIPSVIIYRVSDGKMMRFDSNVSSYPDESLKLRLDNGKLVLINHRPELSWVEENGIYKLRLPNGLLIDPERN